MANDLLRGRQTVAFLTNKSGGGVVAGDVVILGSATASSFITTTSAAQTADWVGVALETIADNASGRVCTFGYVPLINLASSASLGDYLRTHTVAKQAQRFAATGAGDFGQVLGTGTTPPALIWARPDQGAAAAAPTTAEYLTTAADGGLSAEVVIPGLAGSADRAGIYGGGTSREFDAAAQGPTWAPSDPTFDTDTTVKSHLYVSAADATERFGFFAWTPGAGAFSARAKINAGLQTTGAGGLSFGLMLADAGNTNRLYTDIVVTPATPVIQARAFSYTSSTYTQRGSSWTVGKGPIYVRIDRNGGGTIDFFWSGDGLVWHLINGSLSFAITVTQIGFRFVGVAAVTSTMICDWVRTDV